MKYMLLIHQGTTPLPGTPEWDALSDEQKGAVYAGYQAVNETPGMTPGVQMASPETATTVRVQEGRTLTTDGPFVDIKEAVAEADGPEAGLEIIDGIDLDDYRCLHATRGDLLRCLGRTAEARDAFRRALALVDDEAERRLLERRLAELGAA